MSNEHESGFQLTSRLSAKFLAHTPQSTFAFFIYITQVSGMIFCK